MTARVTYTVPSITNFQEYQSAKHLVIDTYKVNFVNSPQMWQILDLQEHAFQRYHDDRTKNGLSGKTVNIILTSHECRGVDHRQYESLFNRLFRLTVDKHRSSELLVLYERNPPVIPA